MVFCCSLWSDWPPGSNKRLNWGVILLHGATYVLVSVSCMRTMVISNHKSLTEGSVGSIDNGRVRDATGAFSAKVSQVVPKVQNDCTSSLSINTKPRGKSYSVQTGM